MIKNIFFDLDGTIIDSAPGIIKALRYTYHQAALSVPDDSVLRKFIGPPLLESIEKYTKISPESELARQLLRGFQEYYGRSGWQEMRLYPQIVPVLKQLQQSGHRLYCNRKTSNFCEANCGLFKDSAIFCESLWHRFR